MTPNFSVTYSLCFLGCILSVSLSTILTAFVVLDVSCQKTLDEDRRTTGACSFGQRPIVASCNSVSTVSASLSVFLQKA